MYENDYSPAEVRMFTKLGYSDILANLPPPALYRVACEQCFLQNLAGKAVDALRRGANAINASSPYRLTDEFDNLIRF